MINYKFKLLVFSIYIHSSQKKKKKKKNEVNSGETKPLNSFQIQKEMDLYTKKIENKIENDNTRTPIQKTNKQRKDGDR